MWSFENFFCRCCPLRRWFVYRYILCADGDKEHNAKRSVFFLPLGTFHNCEEDLVTASFGLFSAHAAASSFVKLTSVIPLPVQNRSNWDNLFMNDLR